MYNRKLLQNNLDKLRRNKENISMLDLETKYVKPYKALIKDIKIQHREMLIDVLKGVMVGSSKRDDVEAHFRQTCEIVEKKLYEEYDAEGAEEALRNFIGEEFISKNIVLCFEEVEKNEN